MTENMIEIKQADRNNFCETSMDSFDRFQEVQNVWRIRNGRHGQNRTQRIVIYYRFVGYIELPDTAFRRSDNYKVNTRKGVAVEYIPQPA